MKNLLDSYDIVLYHEFPARSTRVKWMLVELGIDEQVLTTYVNLRNGEHRQPPYLAVNPLGVIPSLELTHKSTKEKTIMTESAAICTFLGQVSASPLQPPVENISAMATYHRIIAFTSSTVDHLLWEIRMHEQLLPPHMRQQKIAEQAKEKYTSKVVPVLESVVEGGYVTAPHYPHFTTADIMLAYTIFWANLYKINTPVLQRYMKQMISRASFQKVVSDAPRSLDPSAS